MKTNIYRFVEKLAKFMQFLLDESVFFLYNLLINEKVKQKPMEVYYADA